MTPLDAIRALAKANPAAATLILTAIAGFAAVATIASFGIDLQSSVQPVLYVVGVGVFISIVTAIVINTLIMSVLQWFFVVIAILWGGAFVASRALPDIDWLNCTVRFWDTCETTADRLAAQASRAAPPIKPATAVPSDSSVVPGNYQVFVQFAGILDRDNIRDMMRGLAGNGWQVQGVQGGGQRTGTAAGFNEIRYRSESDAPAAKALAASVQSTKIVPTPITTTLTPDIKPGTLEVYISH